MAKTYEVEIGQLIPDGNNFNRGTDEGKKLIRKSLHDFGAGRSVLIDKDNRIIAGNKTHENADAADIRKVIVVETDGTELVAVKRTDIGIDTKEGRELALADNATAHVNLEWNVDELTEAADDYGINLDDWGFDFTDTEMTGTTDTFGEIDEIEKNSLEDYFIVPPFSVLDTRSGRWQQRKQKWVEILGNNGETREDALGYGSALRFPRLYQKYKNENLKEKYESFDKYLETLTEEEKGDCVLSVGVSLFDPVLSEVCAKWFTPSDGCKIFDPFAGDTNKGIVFGLCGHSFTGIELRQEQVDENKIKLSKFDVDVHYICDDGQNVRKHIEDESQDFLFSCPPYFDLEVYSDDPRDASNQDNYTDFLKIIEKAFKESILCLKENRFAVIVVGDVRGESGAYYDLPSDIKRIFREAGLHLINDMILVEVCGSAAIRASKPMEYRKTTKTHQNVLVFYKGNPLGISNNFFPIDMSEDEKESVRETIKELETEEMVGLSDEEYAKAIADEARKRVNQYLVESGTIDVKNAITWANGMENTKLKKPIVDYFINARKESGKTMKEIAQHLGNNMGGHYFTDKSQWLLPTREAYAKLQEIMPQLTKGYDELLKEIKTLQNVSRLQNVCKLQNLSRKTNVSTLRTLK